jgi:hypothetical protein
LRPFFLGVSSTKASLPAIAGIPAVKRLARLLPPRSSDRQSRAVARHAGRNYGARWAGVDGVRRGWREWPWLLEPGTTRGCFGHRRAARST